MASGQGRWRLHYDGTDSHCRPGDKGILDHQLGRGVECIGFSAAPIPWPLCYSTNKPRPIFCSDLLTAVRTESASAIAHHWGVSVDLVTTWRKKLGVGRMATREARARKGRR